MKITTISIDGKKIRIRKLPDEEKRVVRETIAERLAAGELSLGDAVRLMRLAVGMTQVQYAKMVHIDMRVLADIEKGEGNPRLDTLEKLAKPYGLQISFVKKLLSDQFMGATMPILTSRDHKNMDNFIETLLDDFKNGTVTKEQAASGLAHVMTALDNGEASEVRNWFEQGRSFVRGES